MEALDTSNTSFTAAETAYAAGRFQEAANKYRESIAAHPSAMAYEKLALALYQLSDFADLEATCNNGISLAQQTAEERSEAFLRMYLGIVYYRTGKLNEALRSYQTAQTIFRRLKNLQGQALTLFNMGNVFHRKGMVDDAFLFYNDSLKISTEIGDTKTMLGVLSATANVRLERKEFEAALDGYRVGLGVIGESGDLDQKALFLNNVGTVYLFQSKFDEALVALRQALAIFRQLGSLRGEAEASANIGSVYAEQGDYSKALEMLEEARSKITKAGVDSSVQQKIVQAMIRTSNKLGIMANEYLNQNELEPALKLYEKLREYSKALGDTDLEVKSYINMGVVYLKQDNHEKALDCYRHALELSKQNADIAGTANSLINIGLIYFARREHRPAWQHLREAQALYLRLGTTPERLQTAYDAMLNLTNDLGRLATEHYRNGNRDTALVLFREALQHAEELDDLRVQALCLGWIGVILLESGNRSDAIQNIEKAYVTNMKMGNDEGAKVLREQLASLGVKI